jgi:hypothetical protein
MRRAIWSIFWLVTLEGCGVWSAWRVGRETARRDTGCQDFETSFPVPFRYVNRAPSEYLYRGCGEYVVVRCVVSSARTQCSTQERTSIAEVDGPAAAQDGAR